MTAVGKIESFDDTKDNWKTYAMLSEAKLKYSKAVKIAVAMETAIYDTLELQIELNPVPHVEKLTENNTAKPATSPYCYYCSRTRFATTVETMAISSEFVVPNSNSSLSKQPKIHRYMQLRLMLMLMKTS